MKKGEMMKKHISSIALLGMALIHIGTVGNAAILIAAYMNLSFTSGFWERMYHMGLIPGFVVLCVLVLVGMLMLMVTPEKEIEDRIE